MTEDRKDIIPLVVAAIVEATKDLHGEGKCNSAWTKLMLGRIAGQADRDRYYVCGSGLGAEGLGSHGEWLFDQTWYECPVTVEAGNRTYDPHKLEHLALALESEWLDTDNDRLDDFVKLAVSVAETRVMIFQVRTLEAATDACWTMMDAARRVRTGTDADYLFAAYVGAIADALKPNIAVPVLETFPFRFWRTRLQGPLVPIPPA
ncbi:MAG: hypothetical protein P1U88_03790 [Thalassobaculaceae bacterium]|nr:hypothetical protein [Thalassobaculaceae bacterium]